MLSWLCSAEDKEHWQRVIRVLLAIVAKANGHKLAGTEGSDLRAMI